MPSSPFADIQWSPWPHRVALVLACATFPLIWVGGLVTTYDAGMAVPDWPSTYGYNLFRYPLATWVSGPWDLFIEHGHRLLGALSGLLTIAFVVTVWLRDKRGWMKGLSLMALLGVIGQGVLGGMRVLLDDRRLAMIHGCTGPMFFGLCAALCVLTSRRWFDNSKRTTNSDAHRLHVLSVATCVLALAQIVLGAQLRHVDAMASHQLFRLVVVFHLFTALVLTFHIVLLWYRIGRCHQDQDALLWSARVLIGLIVCQLVLGTGTWLVKYSWPTWLDRWAFGFTIEAEGMLQVLTVTSHVAVGSLILAVSVMLALRGMRMVVPSAIVTIGTSTVMEAAA